MLAEVQKGDMEEKELNSIKEKEHRGSREGWREEGEEDGEDEKREENGHVWETSKKVIEERRERDTEHV